MEIVKLRAHNIVKMVRMATHEENLLENHIIARIQGYEEEVIDTVNWLYFEIFSNPQQLIEVLPEQDYLNDPICQSCIKKKAEHQCELPLLPGTIGHDKEKAKQYGLEFGATISVGELWKKKPIIVFT